MWRTPVTFGGGMTMEKLGLFSSMVAVKSPSSIHLSYHFVSTSLKS